MIKPTNLQVWREGEETENRPCDEGDDGELESNGGVEHVMTFMGKRYSVITDWNDNLRRPHQLAREME